MGRIPEEEIARLKREIPIQTLVEERGVKLKRHGADLIGLCPHHDDTSPSLVVSPAPNLFNCLGACRGGGSTIDWVMRDKGVSFRHAVEILRGRLPSLAASSFPSLKDRAEASRPSKTVFVLEAGDKELLESVVAYYEANLRDAAEAQRYLEKRGIARPEAVERFRIGFANRTLGYRLPSSNTKAGADLRGRLEVLGIMRASGHEHFTGCLVFPIFGEAGELLGMYGRRVSEDARGAIPRHIYLPGPHRGVWNAAALAAAKEVILCEAIIDALSFWCAGFRNVIAAYGVNGFTDDHREAMKKHGTKRVLIAYDRDDAGEKAAKDLAQELLSAGMECFRVRFPKGMDANDYARAVRPPEKSLAVALRSALWMGEGPAPSDPPGYETCPASLLVIEATKEEKPVPKTVSPGLHEPPPGEVSSLAAAVVPSAGSPPPSLAAGKVHEGDEVALVLEGRRYRVRGLARNTTLEALKVNLLAAKGDAFHVDNLDLYSARQRAGFVEQAAREIGVEADTVKKDLGKLLLRLEELQAEAVRKAVEPKKKTPVVSEADTAAAMELLKDPRLFDRILADFQCCGVVGEETNKLVGYLAAVSRKLEDPLAVVIQSSSAAGKSSLMDAILAFVPEEDRVKYSAMTGQSLFYIGEKDLAHKVLAVVEEKGAERASYSLKLLQSEGELSIASTGKDPATGRMVTHEYRVEGPVMIFLTTTAIEIDEELLNRCIVLSVDEDRAQTRAIHKAQRERQTLEGLLARHDAAAILKRHRDAQRLLRPLLVANPHARELTFLDDRTRMRRDHMKYLTLIRTIALLHQHQRPVKRLTQGGHDVEYIEATPADIALANRLAGEVLGRSLDELPPQTRRLLMLLDEMVRDRSRELKIPRAEVRFTRREARERTGLSHTQLVVHLSRLVDLEYVAMHHGGRGAAFCYELAYDGQGKDGRPFLPGLIDAGKLGEYDRHLSGVSDQLSGSNRLDVGPLPGGNRHHGKNGTAAKERTSGEESPATLENASAAACAATAVRTVASALPLAARLSART